MNEPKDQRRVDCKAHMSQSLYVTAHSANTNEVTFVSVEGSRVSLDMSPAEAKDLAAALVWAANGGNQSRSGTQETGG